VQQNDTKAFAAKLIKPQFVLRFAVTDFYVIKRDTLAFMTRGENANKPTDKTKPKGD